MCVANVQYKKPTPDDGKRAKNLLRYLTYRESRDEAARYVAGKERWVDHGMGGSVAEIAKQCEALHGDHVLLFSLVVNPNPELMAMVAPDEREQFVHDLTERVVDDFFEARGLDTGIEYSYVMHHRLTDDKEAPGRHNPHTHVVLPGTVYDEEHGSRVNLFFSQNRKVNHIDMLHDITEEAMAELMERYVGPEWEQIYDLWKDMRDHQSKVVETEPHGTMVDEEGMQWPVWCGSRCTDHSQSAVGYYREYRAQDDSDITQFEFRPLLSGLSHEESAVLAHACIAWMERDGADLPEIKEVFEGMTLEDRAEMVEEMKQMQVDDLDLPHSTDIDF